MPDHPESVATTWSLSFTRVQERSAAAADLLRVCAFLHPDAIPEEIITEGASALGTSLQDVAQNPLAFNQAIGVLLSYSLLKRKPEEHLLSMHRLVQAVYQALPTEVDYGPYAHYDRCLPHAQECARLIEREHLTSSDARWLLYQTGRYLWKHARYDEAEAFYQYSLHIMEQVLGLDHPDVASPLQGLGLLYYEQGKYAEAEPLYQRALRILEQALEHDHSLTREVVRNLATLLRKMGRESEASELEARFSSS